MTHYDKYRANRPRVQYWKHEGDDMWPGDQLELLTIALLVGPDGNALHRILPG